MKLPRIIFSLSIVLTLFAVFFYLRLITRHPVCTVLHRWHEIGEEHHDAVEDAKDMAASRQVSIQTLLDASVDLVSFQQRAEESRQTSLAVWEQARVSSERARERMVNHLLNSDLEQHFKDDLFRLLESNGALGSGVFFDLSSYSNRSYDIFKTLSEKLASLRSDPNAEPAKDFEKLKPLAERYNKSIARIYSAQQDFSLGYNKIAENFQEQLENLLDLNDIACSATDYPIKNPFSRVKAKS